MLSRRNLLPVPMQRYIITELLNYSLLFVIVASFCYRFSALLESTRLLPATLWFPTSFDEANFFILQTPSRPASTQHIVHYLSFVYIFMYTIQYYIHCMRVLLCTRGLKTQRRQAKPNTCTQNPSSSRRCSARSGPSRRRIECPWRE